jgi:hypothetical protein
MKIILKGLKFKVLIGTIILLLVTLNNFGRICANGSGGGYGDGSGEDARGAGISNIWIEMYVIEGAKYFLSANSEIMTFLNRVENSEFGGMDFTEARQVLDRAFLNMHYATSLYTCLIWIAEMTPYNEDVITQLVDFDYNGFMMENGLNSSIFGEVAGYLQKGDITGTYKHIHERFKTILDIIKLMQADINAGKVPSIPQCWRLGETCSQTLLFGGYLSRVFYSLDK